MDDEFKLTCTRRKNDLQELKLLTKSAQYFQKIEPA
jgi:hypothetical protein